MGSNPGCSSKWKRGCSKIGFGAASNRRKIYADQTLAWPFTVYAVLDILLVLLHSKVIDNGHCATENLVLEIPKPRFRF